MSDKSTESGSEDSKGVEYFDDIPVTAEGSINIVAVVVRRSTEADSDAQTVVLGAWLKDQRQGKGAATGI